MTDVDEMKTSHSILRTLGFILVGILLMYLILGSAFHFAWKSELNACREYRLTLDEFVEPEVFGGGLGFFFDVTYWPVYTWANLYHDGTPFATPCTK